MPDKQRLGTFLLGGAVGALAGILLAPRSGRETRGSIATSAGEARERGREAYFDAQERMRERLAERPAQSWEMAEERSAEDTSEAGGRVIPNISGGEPADLDELRERVRATRARLRARLGGNEDAGGPE